MRLDTSIWYRDAYKNMLAVIKWSNLLVIWSRFEMATHYHRLSAFSFSAILPSTLPHKLGDLKFVHIFDFVWFSLTYTTQNSTQDSTEEKMGAISGGFDNICFQHDRSITRNVKYTEQTIFCNISHRTYVSLRYKLWTEWNNLPHLCSNMFL